MPDEVADAKGEGEICVTALALPFFGLTPTQMFKNSRHPTMSPCN